MGVVREFIGWDKPVLTSVARCLLPDASASLRDLSDILVVVPSRQAGRRLRETLAATCARDDTGLLAPRVVTPSWFTRGTDEPAPSLQVSAVWTRLLLQVDPAHYPNLFPAPPPERDLAWALETGAMLQELRESLAEGGLRCEDVPGQAGDRLPEPLRWRELAALERRFLRHLTACGFHDPCVRMLSACANPVLPDGIRQVVVAATPDPPPIVIRALDQLAARMEIRVLVHAPAERGDGFDAWGRPLVEPWASGEIPIPDPDRNLVLGGSPAGQAHRVLAALQELPPEFGMGDVAVGVPDRSLVPILAGELRGHGLAGYDPAGQSLADHPVYRLLDVWARLVQGRAYEDLSEFLRHPDVLGWLCDAHLLTPTSLLDELDRFQNRHLPVSIDELHHQLAGYEDTRCATLRLAWNTLRDQMERYARTPFVQAVAGLLQEIYGTRTLSADEPVDRRFMDVAGCVRDGLDEVERCALDELEVPDSQRLPMLLRVLADRWIYPEREAGALDLEGWLELPWNDAPYLVVTGMNEGAVPDSRVADPFLPDQLRACLGLRPDLHRLARDAFLMRGLIEARRTSGRTLFIVGKTGSLGDPLKPSRLVLQCSDEVLPERVAVLFGPAREPQENLPATVSFPLRPPVAAGPVTRLHATAFGSYLACPFRFYLSDRLGMAPLDDTKPELDALDFGNLIHHAFERMADHSALASATDPEVLAEFLCGVATRWVHGRVGSHLPLQVELQLHAARQRLKAAARIQADWSAAGWRIEEAERRLDVEIEGVQVVGKIDRIDRHQETGERRVIDYKTSDLAVSPGKVHLGAIGDDTRPYARTTVQGKPRAWSHLQLPLYRILLEQTGWTGPLTLGYFNLPKAIQDTGFAWWDAFDDDLLASARACAVGVIHDLHDGRFWPPGNIAERVDEFSNLFHGPPDELFQVECGR